MHGLPTERATERSLGISGKEEIARKIGSEQFVELCRMMCIKNMQDMNETFKKMGKK
jgi:isoleucyl-tRNA synthetase